MKMFQLFHNLGHRRLGTLAGARCAPRDRGAGGRGLQRKHDHDDRGTRRDHRRR